MTSSDSLLGKSTEPLIPKTDAYHLRDKHARTSSSFPVRDFNASLYSRCELHPNAPCDCEFQAPSVAYCGRSVSSDGRILVEESESGSWSSQQLATCKSRWVCDFCARRMLVDARSRAKFHVAAHLASGGQIVHLTLTMPHELGDDVGLLLGQLDGARDALLASKAWKGLGHDEWIRVLQFKYSRVKGWHPHYHFLLLFDGRELDVSALEESVRSTWNNRLEKQSRRQPGDASTRARQMSSIEEALYPWLFGPDDQQGFEEEFHPDNYADWWDDDGPDFSPAHARAAEFHVGKASRSMTPWSLGRVAAAGCAQAAVLWEQFYRATKGRSVVSYSKGLGALWKEHEATIEPPARRPVALVESRLWNRVRFLSSGSRAEAGLNEGRWRGVEAMAQLWADALGVELKIDPSFDGLPYVFLASGDPYV